MQCNSYLYSIPKKFETSSENGIGEVSVPGTALQGLSLAPHFYKSPGGGVGAIKTKIDFMIIPYLDDLLVVAESN